MNKASLHLIAGDSFPLELADSERDRESLLLVMDLRASEVDYATVLIRLFEAESVVVWS